MANTCQMLGKYLVFTRHHYKSPRIASQALSRRSSLPVISIIPVQKASNSLIHFIPLHAKQRLYHIVFFAVFTYLV